MVVKYLEHLVETTVPGGFYPTSLTDLVTNHKENNDSTPLIVMDASSCVSTFTKNLNTMCNGPLKEFQENIQNFVKMIGVLEAKLVVFFPGSPDFQTRETWVAKRVGKLLDTEKCFDAIKIGEKTTSSNLQLMSAHMCAKNTFKSMKSCDVFTSIQECDEEIMEYLHQSDGCVALLAQDSDYIIYESDIPYISLKSLNLNTLECSAYDKKKLCDYLSLEISQLPLFATLMGNEIVNYFNLKNFHIKNCRNWKDRKQLAKGVADFVKTCPKPPMLYQDLKKLAYSIRHKEVTADLLKKSLDMYLKGKEVADSPSDEDQAEIVELATEKCAKCELAPAVLRVLKSNEFRTNNDLEDLRDESLQPAARLMRPMRKRMYGILLHDSNNTQVTEWCVEGNKSPRTGKYILEPVALHAEKPRKEHPGLIRLWKDESEEAETMKWALFCDAISSKLNPDDVRSLPPELVFPAVVLFYYENELPTRFITKWEMECFIVVALMAKNMPVEKIREIEIPVPNLRALQLSSKFLRGCAVTEMLNQSCGFVVSNEDGCPCNYFDGKYFQQTYQRMKEGSSWEDLCGSEMSITVMFHTMCDVIFNRS